MLSTEYPFERLPSDDRMTTTPIGRGKIWALYQRAQACFWTTAEVKLVRDPPDYHTKLIHGQRHAVKFIHGFFATADKIVNVNILDRFRPEIDIFEVTYFYNFQTSMEDVHAHMYSIILDSIGISGAEREELIAAVENIPVIGKMIGYMKSIIDSTKPLAARLLMMACVEGIFFTGCFCIIYWLGSLGLMPGLVQANELIARDEALHTEFALLLYTMVKPEFRLSDEEVHVIFSDATDIAVEFAQVLLPEDMPGMNSRLMSDYIRCQADVLINSIGHKLLYRASHHFIFMDQQNMENKTSSFERQVTNYAKEIAGIEMVDNF